MLFGRPATSTWAQPQRSDRPTYSTPNPQDGMMYASGQRQQRAPNRNPYLNPPDPIITGNIQSGQPGVIAEGMPINPALMYQPMAMQQGQPVAPVAPGMPQRSPYQKPERPDRPGWQSLLQGGFGGRLGQMFQNMPNLQDILGNRMRREGPARPEYAIPDPLATIASPYIGQLRQPSQAPAVWSNMNLPVDLSQLLQRGR